MSVGTTDRAHATPCRPEPAGRRAPSEWVDRVLGSDPGLTRLLSALQAVVTIGLAMLAERVFVSLTHALQLDTHGAVLPPEQAALVAAQHHGMLVIAIMLGAMVGMMASFGGAMFTTPRAQLTAFAFMPVGMIAGMSLGLSIGGHRVLALASLVVVLALGAYCRRFGPLGFMGGMVVFMGDFFGFFLHGQLSVSDLGWLTAEILVGVVVAAIAQFTLFYPGRRAALKRMLRSYSARARRVSNLSLELLDVPEDRKRTARTLHRRLVRLNEAALMIDGQLANPAAVPQGWSATLLHQRLFDSELALTNMARLTERIADIELPDAMRTQVRAALAAVGQLDLIRAELAGHELLSRLRGHAVADGAHAETADGLDRSGHVVVHRFAVSVLGFVEAAQAWRDSVDNPSEEATEQEQTAFETPVMLFGGWLPGSAMVSAAASIESGHRLLDKIRLTPNARVAIQMSVAVTGAIVLGDVLSGRRFYWAVIAAFVTFMGANNSGEQIRKGAFRVTGTVIGVLLGGIGAHLVGDRTDLAIAVILVSLFFGMYLMRISYAFMVVGITIMVAQLYVQLDEYSNSLLVLRLEETALGAAIAAVTVLCVVPLRTGRVARVAVRQYIEAMSTLVELAVQRLLKPAGGVELRAATRGLDNAYQALVTTMVPMRLPFTSGASGLQGQILYSASASRHYARDLLADTVAGGSLSEQAGEELERAGKQLSSSLAELIAAGQDGRADEHSYVRSAGLFDLVSTHIPDRDFTAPAQLALRDLQLIDGAMAHIAKSAGMPVQALDTSGVIEQ